MYLAGRMTGSRPGAVGVCDTGVGGGCEGAPSQVRAYARGFVILLIHHTGAKTPVPPCERTRTRPHAHAFFSLSLFSLFI